VMLHCVYLSISVLYMYKACGFSVPTGYSSKTPVRGTPNPRDIVGACIHLLHLAILPSYKDPHLKFLLVHNTTSKNMPSSIVAELHRDLTDCYHRAQVLSEDISRQKEDHEEEAHAASSTASDPLDKYRSYAVYLRLDQDDDIRESLLADAARDSPQDTPRTEDTELTTRDQSERPETIDTIYPKCFFDPIIPSSNGIDLTDHEATPITSNMALKNHVHTDQLVLPPFLDLPALAPPNFSFNHSSRTSDSTASYVNHDLGRLADRESLSLRVVNVTDPDMSHHNMLHDSYAENDLGRIGALYIANNRSAVTFAGSEHAVSEFEGTRPRRHLSTSRRVNASEVAQRLVLGTPRALVRRVTVLGVGLHRGGGRALR
jgi:hypothetical protein